MEFREFPDKRGTLQKTGEGLPTVYTESETDLSTDGRDKEPSRHLRPVSRTSELQFKGWSLWNLVTSQFRDHGQERIDWT